MTPPTFRIGDEVVIIGPTVAGHSDFTGHEFKIDCECHGTYAGEGYPWYPAGSLRLVEELKIGDYVEIIDAPYGLSIKCGVGGITRVLHETDEGNFTLENNDYIYARSALRKLTPEEMQPIKVIPTAEDNAKRLDAHREEIDAVNERLSTIEHRESAICKYNIETEQRLQKLESIQQHHAIPVPEKLNEIQELRRRIHDLEMSLNGFTNGPEPENVSMKVSRDLMQSRSGSHSSKPSRKMQRPHAAYTTYTYKPGEEGTITVHCSCGRKHEIEATPRAHEED